MRADFVGDGVGAECGVREEGEGGVGIGVFACVD